jgi:hypothetical protein
MSSLSGSTSFAACKTVQFMQQCASTATCLGSPLTIPSGDVVAFFDSQRAPYYENNKNYFIRIEPAVGQCVNVVFDVIDLQSGDYGFVYSIRYDTIENHNFNNPPFIRFSSLAPGTRYSTGDIMDDMIIRMYTNEAGFGLGIQFHVFSDDC